MSQTLPRLINLFAETDGIDAKENYESYYRMAECCLAHHGVMALVKACIGSECSTVAELHYSNNPEYWNELLIKAEELINEC